MHSTLDLAMARIYAGRVEKGKIAIDDVPSNIRSLVEEILKG